MKRLLIIEDQPDIRRLLRMTLEDTDYQVSEATDGASGLALAIREQPDVVLMDIMMPGAIDGLDACRRIKAGDRTRHAKVVMISARGHRHDLLIGRDAGADDYLIKPFSSARLLEVLQALEASSA